MRAVGGLASLIAVLAVTSSCAAEPGSRVAPRPKMAASLVQERVDEGSRRVQLRLTNRGRRPVRVVGAGLAWAGYATRTSVADTVYRPGRTIDLPTALPQAACAEVRGRPRVRVETGHSVLSLPLDDVGVRAIRQLWHHDCALSNLAEAAQVRFTGRWQRAGHTLHGAVEVVRRGPGKVVVTGMSGSVLLDLEPARSRRLPAWLAPGARRIAVPVVLRSNGRCDPHALGGSTQTFLLRVVLRVAGSDPVQAILEPDLRTQDRMLGLVTSACAVE